MVRVFSCGGDTVATVFLLLVLVPMSISLLLFGQVYFALDQVGSVSVLSDSCWFFCLFFFSFFLPFLPPCRTPVFSGETWVENECGDKLKD
jgi:hypothetical protein